MDVAYKEINPAEWKASAGADVPILPEANVDHSGTSFWYDTRLHVPVLSSMLSRCTETIKIPHCIPQGSLKAFVKDPPTNPQ